MSPPYECTRLLDWFKRLQAKARRPRRTTTNQEKHTAQSAPWSSCDPDLGQHGTGSKRNAVHSVPDIVLTPVDDYAMSGSNRPQGSATPVPQVQEIGFLESPSGSAVETPIRDTYDLHGGENQSAGSGDLFVPHTISYTISSTLHDSLLDCRSGTSHVTLNGEVPWNAKDSYSCIERDAKQEAENKLSSSDVAKELHFRYGSCTIISKDGRCTQKLTSLQDWKEICALLISKSLHGLIEKFHIDISRQYFAVQSRPRGNEFFKDVVRTELFNLMKPSLDSNMYIPRVDLVQIMSLETTRYIIMQDTSSSIKPEEKEHLVQRIQAGSTTLLAICIYGRLELGFLKKLLDCGFTDKSLLPHNIKDFRIDGHRADVQVILDKRGSFLAPEFNTPYEQNNFPPHLVLPIQFYPARRDTQASEGADVATPGNESVTLDEMIENSESRRRAQIGAGAFSKVYRVRLDSEHHSLTKDRECDFAMKEFTDTPTVSIDFDKEVKILEELCKFDHPHIVTHLSAWTQGDKYHMLLPYANWNLREYMKRYKFGPNNKDNIVWLLQQLRGLSDALEQVHSLTELPESAGSKTLVVPTKPEGMRKSGWHHDLRLENILWFSEGPYKLGTFRLSDFGSGKVHALRSGSKNTRTQRGTPTYEPPDMAINNHAISRPYDIWSLGCIFVELLLWAVFGNETVDKLREARLGRRFPDSDTDQVEDDSWWYKKEKEPPSHRAEVKKEISHLRDHIEKQAGQPFKEVMDLVDKMLDTNPLTRIKALNLSATLGRICKQKAIDLGKADNDLPTRLADPHRSSIRLSLEAETVAPLPASKFASNSTEEISQGDASSTHFDQETERYQYSSLSAPRRCTSLTDKPISPSSSRHQRNPSSSSGHSKHGSTQEVINRVDEGEEDEESQA